MNNWKDIFPEENRYFETDNGILYKGDCAKIIKEFPDNSIDLIITDPPYLISYKTNHRKDKTHEFRTEIKNDNLTNISLINIIIKEYERIIKNNT